MTDQPGTVVLFGSGETSTDGQRVHEGVMRQVRGPVRACVLETPAGFELNSAAVAGRLADFLRIHLQNHAPSVEVIAARRRGTVESPDSEAITAPIARANYVMLGPGSPTYAIRQLRDSLAWSLVLTRHRLGHPLVLASAAAIAVSAYALPVYEIYKVGEDLHWLPGLNLFGPYGANLAIVPHWNNVDGGEGLDTRRCFMGVERFNRLVALLPDGVTVLGISERTALVVDFQSERLRVVGPGPVEIIRDGVSTIITSDVPHPLALIGITHNPEPGEGIPRCESMLLDRARGEDVVTAADGSDEVSLPPDDVRELAEARAKARGQRDWQTADRLRDLISDRGWEVRDGADGFQLYRT